jgi:ABC-type branched-subunit amino acid transport system substrate-binding protein/ABC-type amino acid transport substrate-binding protein
MFQAAIILSQQYNITVQGQFITWQAVQTGGNAMNALSNTCSLTSKSNIVGIVGPEFSSEALFIAPFSAKIDIPVISHSATDPELSDQSSYPTFYRTTPSDNIAGLAMVDLFNRYNWTSCVIVYQNDAFGSGGVTSISTAFNANKLTVINTLSFDVISLTIQGNLKSFLTSSGTGIVILWAATNYATMIIQNALDADVLGPQFLWICRASASLNNFNNASYDKLSGIFTIIPVAGNAVNAPINTTLLNAAYNIWQQYNNNSFPGPDNVNYYALFAFDATWTLIQALQQLCSNSINNSSTCISFTNDSFCFNRQFLNSDLLFNIINNITFLGVSGLIQFSANSTDRVKGGYYILQNLQRSPSGLNNIPVLVWSVENKWKSYTQTDTIIWPGNSTTPPSGNPSIAGLTFRIAVIESVPFTIVTQVTDKSGQTTTQLSGYMPHLIDLLQAKMKFIPNITLVSSNVSYDGLIDAVVNGDYDMVVADMAITDARSEIVDFSYSIFDNSLRIIIRQPVDPPVDLWSFLRPFSLKLWITLLAAAVCGGLLFAVIERDKNEVLENRSTPAMIIMGLWYSFGTIVGYGVDFNVTTAAGRLFTLGLYILCLISVAAYTANLTSNLTLSRTNTDVSGISDLQNGKISFSRIGIVTGTPAEDYYLRVISSGLRNFYPLKSTSQIYTALLNQIIDASIMDDGIAEYITSNIYCNLSIIGTSFEQNSFGIVIQKNWAYAKDLDVSTLALSEAGDLNKLRTKWFSASTCAQLPDDSTAMTLESMAGLFLTFALICVLALLLFMWQKRIIIKNFILSLIYGKTSYVKEDVNVKEDSTTTISQQLSIQNVIIIRL